MKRWVMCVLVSLGVCALAEAQSLPPLFGPIVSQNPYMGGRVSGAVSDTELPLSLSDAIDRGLEYNLGLFLSSEQSRAAQASRIKALSDLLPHLHGGVTESVQQINIAAFGFPPSDLFPSIIGPFTVFDVRASLTQTVLDMNAIHKLHSETDRMKAEEMKVRDTRDLVVLVVANLYLQATASVSRVDALASQLQTAEALYKQAQDMKAAGMVAGIDVLRAQVEMESRRQRLIGARNDVEKQKLSLARAIGIPLSQPLRLTDPIQPAPEPGITLEQALAAAYNTRGDYLAAQSMVKSAESAKKAASSKYLPSLLLQADYGDLGTTPAESHGTFSVIAGLRIPIFEGGRTRGEVLEADSQLESRKAQLDDLRALIEQQVRTAFLDLNATRDQIAVATNTLDLARQQMQQAQDRFAAGVADNLEVVQAQETLAVAHENYIASLFAGGMAKAMLARATGAAEATAKAILGGKPTP